MMALSGSHVASRLLLRGGSTTHPMVGTAVASVVVPTKQSRNCRSLCSDHRWSNKDHHHTRVVRSGMSFHRRLFSVDTPSAISHPDRPIGSANEMGASDNSSSGEGAREKEIAKRLESYMASVEQKWEENFRLVEKLVEERGPTFAIEDMDEEVEKQHSLKHWMRRQRMEYNRRLAGKESWMTERRQKELESLGLTTLLAVTVEPDWEDRYEEVCNYIRQHDGRFPYSSTSTKEQQSAQERDLTKWCRRQRAQRNRLYKDGISSKEKEQMWLDRFAKLDDINFSWSPREALWNERYHELKEFRKHNGDCLIPFRYPSNPPLSKWVEVQRKQYRLFCENEHTNMTKERIDLLNEIDFVWSVRDLQWHAKYEELVEYMKLNGRGSIPVSDNSGTRALHNWVLYQKKAHDKWMRGEKTTMTPKRKKLLEELQVPLHLDKMTTM